MTLDTLWYSRCPVPTASGIAIQQGWIDDELAPDGIVPRSLASSPDAAVRRAHYLQTSHDLFRHGGAAPVFVAASKGADFKIVGLSWTDTSYPVLTLPESSIRTPGDLKGKRLALSRRVNDPVDFWHALTLRVYEVALAQAGLTLDDVELVERPVQRSYLADAEPNASQRGSLWGAFATAGLQRDEALALARGEVDAIASEAAIAASLTATLRLRTVIDTGRLPSRADRVNNGTPLILTVSGPLLRARPDLVARWLGRVGQAAAWAREHPDQTRRIVAAEAGIAEDFVASAYSPHVHEQLGVSLDADLRDALQVEHDHLLRHGHITEPLDLDGLIDPAPLDAALTTA